MHILFTTAISTKLKAKQEHLTLKPLMYDTLWAGGGVVKKNYSRFFFFSLSLFFFAPTLDRAVGA